MHVYSFKVWKFLEPDISLILIEFTEHDHEFQINK